MVLKNDAPISIFLRNIINYEKIVKETLVGIFAIVISFKKCYEIIGL